MDRPTDVDLVVVGAGAAGLGATKTARLLGLNTLTFEAMARPGGRAFTDSETLGFPWDAGCHWLHSASINPFTGAADRLGFRYRSSPAAWSLWRDGREAGETEIAAMDRFIATALAAATRCANEGIDTSLADVVDLDSPWLDVLRQDINNEWGVDFRAASTVDISRYRDTHENWPVIDGYGALVARVAGDVPVEVNTPVTAINWSGPGVRITTSCGTVSARAAIITVSTSVLADEVIAFEPVLPDWKREAFAAVPLGRADKIGLLLEERVVADVPERNLSVEIGPGELISLRLRPYGRPLVDAYLAGPLSAELAAAGEQAMIEVTVDALASVLGNDMRNQIRGTVHSDWANEPYIRGAYAAARPGQADRRADLRTPLADRLFFAGEATSPEFYSTCHGAWETGEAAAREVARLLGRVQPEG